MAIIELAHAVTAFYEGARLHATGSLLSNNDVIAAGMGKIKQALAAIDAESDCNRDILIPFLTHHDAMVRCEAARALHPTRRELATPVLHDIHLSCLTEAHFVASWFLVFAGEPNHGGDALTSAWPYKYDDALYREALARFDRS